MLSADLVESDIRRAGELKAKAPTLYLPIWLEELSVFIYPKKKGDNSYRYWKAEWRGHNGKMKKVHLGPADG